MTSKVDKYLKTAFKDRDIVRIRNILANFLRKDPADVKGKVQPYLKRIEKKTTELNLNLWQEHDGRLFKEKEDWDKNYLNRLRAQLMNNFSKKRFNHILEVGRFVYRDELNEQSKQRNIRKKPEVYVKNNEVDIKKLIAIIGATLILIIVIIRLIR
ncbi:hypothetical protein [Fuchsiella alkaliacetigena]|uniref:hypothetical protein n=1 Tax=Fuchsiella alkaliacetigena TaxID=957042 RepID=UPI00200ADC48|nr:hypothetical protein [Fuchsiella alkaliacetigena]MCK8823444.1 hypothetical protein [Fuchsiella alkaliacetigena]